MDRSCVLELPPWPCTKLPSSADSKLVVSTRDPLSTNSISNKKCWVQEELEVAGRIPLRELHVEVQARSPEYYNAEYSTQKENTSKEKVVDELQQNEDEEKKEEGVSTVSGNEGIDLGTCAPSTLVKLLKVCAERHDLRQGIQIHTSIAKRGIFKDNVFVGSAIVNMYAKCGALKKAQEAFDGLSIQNVVSWNALIAGYVRHKHDKEAFSCFERMQKEGIFPDEVTFSCILKACSSLGALDKGQDIHAQVVKEGLVEQCRVIGNALVDMYVKCGLLGKAQGVFDELSTLDVVTWTALMTGFVLQGHGEEALRCYNKMQQAGCVPNAVTFLGILKACSSIQAVHEGQGVHAAIVIDGLLEKDIVVGTALVDMYSKCGMMAEAQDVFDEISVRDAMLWSALIDGYAQNMQGQEALKCFEQMQFAGFRPDEITFACVLKACGSLGALDKGQELHNQMAKDKLVGKDPVVSNALIGMYSKCGLYEKAQELFNEMPKRDVVSWNALISGYVVHGHGGEALNCLEKMDEEGLSPDAITFVSVLKACGCVGALDKGQNVHARILREGLLEKHAVIANALLFMYVKCGLPEKAKDIFNQLQVRDSVSWNSIIAGHAQDVHGEEAFNCFQQMQVEGLSADAVTYACVLKACASTGAIDKGEEIHNQILREGLMEKSLMISNSVIDMYAKCGLLEKAQEVFDKLAIRDVVSWNSLIAGYSQHGLGEQALSCFEQMQVAGLSADAITFVCILKACGSIGRADKGQEVHIEIEKAKWLEKDVHVGTALVDMYAKCGLIKKAQEVFEKLSYRDVVSWNALLTGYVQHALGEEVLNCVDQMQSEGIMPDVVSFVCMLKACGSLGAVDKSHDLHAEITKRGWLDNSTISSALVDMYANCGLAMEGRETFDRLSVTDVVSWNALIAGYALLGQDDSMLNVLHEMVTKGYDPDLVTFTTVLNTCSHGGQLDKAQMYFELMIQEFGINPTLKHLTCMVDLFARAGQLDKAGAVILQLPFCVDAAIWHALLGACHRLRDAKLAMWAFKHADQLDLKEASTYVSFSNIYAADHRQENQEGVHMMSPNRSGKSWWPDADDGVVSMFSDEVGGQLLGNTLLDDCVSR
ncbi:hypothetical protein GOP47_0027085 [Adiantum capillus-veneris]|nr:hypothetical protein GOP47_0027085 [Adiantum capillus-veneris]